MIMYGKLFSRMYQGSMVGAGSHVFAVWGYCIANADAELHTVDLNPALLSTVIGDTPDRIKDAIDYLCRPDPHSHCQDYDGARLVHRGGLEYFLVTHEQYRNMQNNEELRQYFREAKRRQRQSETVKESLNTPVSVSASVSASEGDESGREFDECWKLYPDKSGKSSAFKAYQKARKEGVTQADILAGLNRYIAYVRQRQATDFRDLKFKNGSTWFHQRGWEDEYTLPTAQPKRRGPNI